MIKWMLVLVVIVSGWTYNRHKRKRDVIIGHGIDTMNPMDLPSGEPSKGKTVPVSGLAGGGFRFENAFLRLLTIFMYINGPPGRYVHKTNLMVNRIQAAGIG